MNRPGTSRRPDAARRRPRHRAACQAGASDVYASSRRSRKPSPGTSPAWPRGCPRACFGAAFAVELLRALEAAILSDQPTWTGKTIDLFARLHKKGFLSSILADQAGRAALKMLADRTPLVRRLHDRRWCFAFGDIHEPVSALRGRLGVIAAE